MNEVTKEQFKEMYFKYGRLTDGWDQHYWDTFFEKTEPIPMKYMAEEPASVQHTRMMIVSDYSQHEYRLFFLTEEAEEGFFR